MKHCVSVLFLAAVVEIAREKRWVSNEHFSGDFGWETSPLTQLTCCSIRSRETFSARFAATRSLDPSPLSRALAISGSAIGPCCCLTSASRLPGRLGFAGRARCPRSLTAGQVASKGYGSA